MMNIPRLDYASVIARNNELPGFPRLITEILATIDDPEANLSVLSNLILHDPVIAARVLELANRAASRTRHISHVHDAFTAISLIGISRVRQMAVISSLGEFVNSFAASGMASTFWQHSVAVGVSCEELALHVSQPIPSDMALIAGLLHDIGQLWLYRFCGDTFRTIWRDALANSIGIEIAEREHFGVDHTVIGGWLVEHWALPKSIQWAVSRHHDPDQALSDPMVPVVHLAEVLANALDLTGRDENRVTMVSTAACKALKMGWDESSDMLFGRIEARSRHASEFFTEASH